MHKLTNFSIFIFLFELQLLILIYNARYILWFYIYKKERKTTFKMIHVTLVTQYYQDHNKHFRVSVINQ